MEDPHYEYLIIGGGIAGVTAAETIRGRDQTGRIAIVSLEPHLLYSRVLLPSFVRGRIGRERVFLRSREDFAKSRIDLYLGREVAGVDAERREVMTKDGGVFGFKRLLASSGGAVKHWQHQEAQDHIYRLQTIDDADRLVASFPSIREPLVVGSSFIALEFIEIFLHHGIVPRMITQEEHFFGAFLDKEGGEIIEANVTKRGVKCFFGEEIRGVTRQRDWLEVASMRDGALRTDAVAIGIGIERNVSFLKDSGITLGTRGIAVNEYLESDVPGIWAAGDVAEYFDPISDRSHTTGNWTNAAGQGTRAGLNMAGERAAFARVPSYAITNLGFQIAVIGECGRGLSAVARVDPAQSQYERFFLRDGAIVGAFLINYSKDRPHLTELIAHRVTVAPYEDRLRDPAFDIHTIPLVTLK